MNKQSFTPGPWIALADDWGDWGVHAPIIEAVTDCEYVVADNVNGDETKQPKYGTPEANARLIAAAPELYEALDQAVTSMQDSGYPNSHVAVRAARVALAKASA